MATESKRYIHVVGTTTQLTTANDLMKEGELWLDKTLGKFKLAPADGNYNSQAFYIHPWADISGKPSSYPSTIADVTGLTAALAGKASTSHGHTWADISGVPSASAGTAGVVRVGSTLTISGGVLDVAGGGGGGGGFTPGFIFDVRDTAFAGGIAVGPSNARQNTLAIQAAVDAAAVASGGNGNGTVYLPGVERQNGTMIDLESPIWMNCDNTRITGFSKESTVVRSQGPCFAWAKHPRFWDIERKILTDKVTGTKYLARQYENQLTGAELTAANPTLESGQVVYLKNASTGVPTGEYKTGPGAYNSLSLSTGATVFPTPEVAYFSRYKVDLRECRVGGAFPPNGNPEFAPVAGLSTGQRFGLRSWSGAVKGEYWWHPIANGDITQATQSATRWPFHSTVTWQAVIQHITPVWWGGIMGVGSETSPDPFILFGAGDNSAGPGGSPTAGTYYFDLAMTPDGIRKTWLRFTFAQNPTVGIHRIAIQFNPAASTQADRLVVFLDRVRVAVSVVDYSTYYNGYDASASSTGVPANHRIARWEGSQLAVLSENNSAGGFAVGLQHPYLHHCDGIFIAGSAHATLLYTTPSIGGSQVKVGGGSADDSTVWGPSDSTSRTDVLGYIQNSYDWSPNGTPTLAMYLGSNRNMGRGAAGVMGVFGPRSGAHGLAQAPSGNTISDMTLRRYEAWPNGSAVVLYSYINTTTIERCNIADQGYFKSIGSMTCVASYYLHINDCNLGRGVHIANATVYGRNWTFTFTVDSYVRVLGCKFKLDGMTTASIQARDEAVFACYAGNSIGSGIYLNRIQCNFEGLPREPQDAVIYIERAFATAGDGLWIKDSVFGEFASPFVYFADYVGSTADNRTAQIELENVGFSTPSAAITVQGNQWRTADKMIEVGLAAYTSSDVVKYVNARDGENYNAVTTVLRNGHGIPQSGGFVRNSHKVEILYPAPGGPSGWMCDIADVTTKKKEGTNDPPLWRTIGRAPSRNTSSLSANFFPGLHFNCTFTHNGTKTVDFSGVTKAFSRRMLAKTLNATSTAAPTQFKVNFGFYNTYLESPNYDPGFFTTGTLTLSTYFGTSAASGEKSNTTAITLNGLDVPGWDVQLTRPACGMIHLINSGGATPKDGAFAFLTSPWTPADWVITSGTTRTISIGGMSFKRSNRSSGFSDWASNRMIDWATGVSWTPPGTLYFGFSTTEPNQATGANVTEPSGGSYARVAVTSNSSNWGEIRDSSFFGNKGAVTFAQPTGDWGEPGWLVVYDALTSGNFVGAAPINFPIRITASSKPPTFEPGAIVFQV